ncbi:hypothetical protein PsorP6_005591 [Peronosclerospora sorghi]|uniref:Uncharacterized protein n=1 Tax=Peronosclerospora sorghi TaxID=230839 RepID=A0ACC0W2E8_9STRA|nr:hypothetical protein PsorP6_005591 [Peronosclerospora sorghi]
MPNPMVPARFEDENVTVLTPPRPIPCIEMDTRHLAPSPRQRAQENGLDTIENAKLQRVRKPKSVSDPFPVATESKEMEDAGIVELSGVPQPLAMALESDETALLKSEPQVCPLEATSPTRPRKRRRVRKTNLEKMEILAFVDQGGSQGAAAEKFGVSRTAVTKMVKERAAISAQALVENARSSRKVLQYQHKLSVIEDMLYKWQMQVELDAPSVKITGELMQSKAMEFRNKILADYSSDLSDEVIMSLTDFKASNGWLHRYMQRRRMRSLPKMKHEPTHGAMLTDKMNADDRVQRVRELLLTVSPSCIWNLDEITLRHRSTSMKLDSIVNMDARSLERISIAVAMSATGEKLYLQVVGKDPRPESLHDIDPLTSFGIQYRDNGRAAHDVHATSDFLHAMNHEAKMRKQVWYLVLDTCTAHVAAANALQSSGSIQTGFIFESIVLLFMPTGPLSDAQPLQQGILRSFKLRFRHEMLETLLHEHEQWATAVKCKGEESGDRSLVNDVFDVHAHTHMRNTLTWLHIAWNAVPPSFIRQAWSASLYLPAVGPEDTEASASGFEENDMKAFTEVLGRLTNVPELMKALGLNFTDDLGQLLMELLEFDKEATETDEITKDNEIVVESLASQGLLRDTQKSLMLEVMKPDDMPLLTASEAAATVSRLLYFVSQENDNLLTVSERRTGRANLLILQRLLLKVRDREREREPTTDFTV